MVMIGSVCDGGGGGGLLAAPASSAAVSSPGASLGDSVAQCRLTAAAPLTLAISSVAFTFARFIIPNGTTTTTSVIVVH